MFQVAKEWSMRADQPAHVNKANGVKPVVHVVKPKPVFTPAFNNNKNNIKPWHGKPNPHAGVQVKQKAVAAL
jgi:hypothetical protein